MERRPRRSLTEMLTHPWATLAHIQGLQRLPDRRVSKHRAGYGRGGEEPDPIRKGRVQNLYRALGIYALQENRMELYENYREMDSDPMIAAVLDAFAEDAAAKDSEHKRVVWAESPNEDIRKIVTDCLDRCRIDEWAFPVMRGVARDGDVFMHIAAARGDGVVALRPYEPWSVSRIEDDIGRLIGFAPANEQGNPSQTDKNSVAHYRALHFRLPPRELTYHYGAQSSFLWGSRIVWRQLQLMEDQVVIQRLLRRPDRLLVLMDTTGMGHDEAWQTIQDWQRRMHREWYANPAAGEFSSFGHPVDIGKDVVLPRGENNNTQFTNLPATNTNDLLRDLDLFLARLASGIGFPLGFVGRGDPNSYKAGESLSRQSKPFAQRTERLQQCFLREVARLCMIDLAFRGIDPMNPRNAFTLNMATVSPIQEIERNEIIQLKTDRMERTIALGVNAKLDLDQWIPYVLEKYGGLSRELVKRVYKGGANTAPQVIASPLDGPDPVTPPITYSEDEKFRARLHEEVGRLLPSVEDATRVSSLAQAGLLSEGAQPWRPISPDDFGRGRALEESLLKGDALAQLADERLALEARKAGSIAGRAQTRVELLTTLVEAASNGRI